MNDYTELLSRLDDAHESEIVQSAVGSLCGDAANAIRHLLYPINVTIVTDSLPMSQEFIEMHRKELEAYQSAQRYAAEQNLKRMIESNDRILGKWHKTKSAKSAC